MPCAQVGQRGMSVADVWGNPQYVPGGSMTQESFAALCHALNLEQMSFASMYLCYLFGGSSQSVEDVMVVCTSKGAMQRALDALGAKTFGDVPLRLAERCAMLQRDFGSNFLVFFRWLFEMGKAVAALNLGVHASAVRTVPLDVGLQLMEPVLGTWPLMAELKAFW